MTSGGGRRDLVLLPRRGALGWRRRWAGMGVVVVHDPACQRQPIEHRLEIALVRRALDDVGTAVRTRPQRKARQRRAEIADVVRCLPDQGCAAASGTTKAHPLAVAANRGNRGRGSCRKGRPGRPATGGPAATPSPRHSARHDRAYRRARWRGRPSSPGDRQTRSRRSANGRTRDRRGGRAPA